MDDNAITRIIAKLGVDYTEAISSTRMLADVTAQLDRQLRGLKLTVADLARTVNRDLSAQLTQMAGGKVIYDQYGRALSVVGVDTEKVARKTKDATQAAREHAKTVKDLNKEYSVLGSQLERRISWFTAGVGFFGALEAIRQATNTIAEVEMGMTTIARVTEDATFNFEGMRDQLLRLGKEYGMTWDRVSDIAIRWAQAGYNVRDTLELTRASLLALNTAELDANYATQGLIAIMAQWGLTADQLLPTIDKINKVADDFAVTSQDLVDGLNRSSGAARVLGLSLDETIAILTVMREATGRTGKEVGNALNSILSFMQRDIALRAFAREGIAVWADEARTQFRNVREIFEEVAQRWPQLSEASREMFVQAAEQAGLYSEEMAELAGIQKEFNDLQQRDISQAMAGIYRRNYLLALLKNWAKIDEVLISMENSLGYSMRENERTMQTLQKQYEQLKAAAQELAVALGDAGLLDQLKNLVEAGTIVVEGFNRLDDNLQNLILHFVEIVALIKVFNIMLKMSGAESIAKFALSLSGLAGLLGNVGKGLLGFFGGPWGLALTAGGTALVSLISYLRQTNRELEQNASQVVKLYQEYEQYAEKLSTTTEGTARYNQISSEMQRILNDIGAIMPDLITDIDTHGNVLAVNTEKIKTFKDNLEDVSSIQKTIDQEIASVIKKRDDEISRIQQENETLSKLAALYEETKEAARKHGQGSEEAAKAGKTLQDVEKGIIDIIGERAWVEIKSSGDISKAIEELIKVRNKHLNAVRENTLEEIRLIELQKRAQIQAIDAQIRALGIYLDYARQGYSVMVQEMPLLIPPKEETVMGHVFGYTGEEAARIIKPTIDFWNTMRKSAEEEAQKAHRKLTELLTEKPLTGRGYVGPPGTETGKAKAETDALAEAIRNLAEAAENYTLAIQNQEIALAAINRQLSVTTAEYDYLSEKLKTGVFTTDDYARMQVLVAEKISLLRQEQDRLTEANAQYRSVINALRPVLD